MRTLITTLAFTLIACAEQPSTSHEPSLSLSGSWTYDGPTAVWQGLEVVSIEDGADGCEGERSFTAIEVDPACDTCSLSLQVTAVDETGWCLLDEEADIITNGFVIFRPDPVSGEGWVLVAELLEGAWTPYASGVGTDASLVYDHAEPGFRGDRQFDPAELRDLRGPRTQL